MPTPPTVLLAPGASGTAASMSPFVNGLQRHGVAARAIDLPRGRAERAVPVYAGLIGAAPSGFVIGGQSFGGRVASMVAADTPPRGLVLLCYPLHLPGRPEELRTEHWPRIACPVLLLSGEADPRARVDLLRDSVTLLPDARLHTYPGVGHGLKPVLDDAVARIAEFVGAL
jgi:uncharacterized protein